MFNQAFRGARFDYFPIFRLKPGTQAFNTWCHFRGKLDSVLVIGYLTCAIARIRSPMRQFQQKKYPIGWNWWKFSKRNFSFSGATTITTITALQCKKHRRGVLYKQASAKDLNQTTRNLQKCLLITEFSGQCCNLRWWRS